MQDNKTNRDKLYTFLTNKGVTGIGADREEFETIFEDEGKQKKLYDFCVNKGYTGIGKNYDEFAGGFSIQKGAHGVAATILEQASGIPYPGKETDKSQYTFTGEQLNLEESPKGYTQIGRDYKIDPIVAPQFKGEGILGQSTEDYMADVQKSLDARKRDYNQLRQEQGIRAGRQDVVKDGDRYYTPGGSTDSYIAAGHEVDMAKEYNGVPMREIAEYYSLDENKRADYAKSVGRTPEEIEKAYEAKEKGDINNQMSDLSRRIDAGIRGVNQKKSALQSQYEKERGFGGFIKDALMSGSEAELPVLQGQLPGSALEGSREWQNLDKQEKVLWASARQFNTAQKIINAAKSGGFFTGMGDALQDLVLGGSVQDMQDLAAINEVSRKFEKGEKLTAKEEVLLESIAMNVAVASQYKEELSAWYNAGNMVGEMIPYMVEMWMNPLSKLGKKFGQKVLDRAKEKYGKDLAKHLVSTKIKTGAAKLSGAALGGYGMSLTTGLPSVVTGVQKRTLGDAVVDKEMSGDIKYAGRRDAEELGTAIYKETTQKMLDNASEMLGAGYLGKPFSWLQKAGKDTKLLGWIDNVANSKFGKNLNDFFEKTNWNGPLEEFMEEIHVGILEPRLVGDTSWGEFFTGKNLATIAIGVSVPGVAMATAATLQGAKDGAFKAGAKEKWKMERGELRGIEAWGPKWEEVKQKLDSNSLDDVDKVLTEIHNDKTLTPEQKVSAFEYGIYGLQYRTARGVADAFDSRKDMLSEMLRDAYAQAYSTEPTGKETIQASNNYQEVAKRVMDTFQLSEEQEIDDMLAENSIETLANGDSQVADMLYDYKMRKAYFEGAQDRFLDTLEEQFTQSDKSIDKRTNKDNPTAVYSTMYNGEQVDITGGNVVLFENGKVDYDNSSETLYVTFPDNTVKPVSAKNFTEVVTVENAEELKAAGRAEIDNRWRSEFDNAERVIDEGKKRKEGKLFNTSDELGEHTVEVLEEGETESRILLDGKEYPISTEELNQWRNEAGVVPSNTDVETAEAEAPAVSPIPMEKRGNVERAAYHLVPIERTMEDLHDGQLDQNEVQELINARRKEAYNDVQALDKKKPKEPKKPKMEGSKEAYLAAKVQAKEEFDKAQTQWQASMDEAKQRLDYYNELYTREQEITKSEIKEAYDNVQPREVIEMTADEFIANNLPKITPESFKAETGLSNSEQAEMVGYIAGADKGGVTVEQAAESIIENYGDELRSLGYSGDMQDVRDTIINILSQGNPRSYAKQGLAQRKQESIDQQRAEMETVAASLGFKSVEDMSAYEEQVIPGVIQMYTGFDYNEYYNNLAENYEYDTTRESETTGRGGELLQGEQSIDNAGTPVAEGNEGRAVPGSVQGNGTNAAASGNEQVNEPVGNSEQLSSSEIPNNQSVAEGDAPGQSGVDHPLSQEEAQVFITEMEANAEVAPEIELTIENWDSLFGEDGLVETPIGEVKMGENQFAKLMRQGRDGKLGMVKPTLENPDVIIEDESKAKNGETERPSSYVFVKSFKKADGSRYYYFTSVTVSKDGKEVIVSNQEKRRNAIANLLTNGKLVWKHADNVSNASDVANGLYSSQGNSSDLAAEGTDAPQTNVGVNETPADGSTTISPEDNNQQPADTENISALDASSASEDRNSVSNSQENAQKSGEIAENAPEIQEPHSVEESNPLAKHAENIAKRLGVNVTLHTDASTVADRDAMTAIAEGGVIKGWYNPNTGEIALFLPNMESMRDVESTILHEAVSHYGIKHLLGREQFNEFLDGVWEMMPAGTRAHFLQYVGADMANPSKAKMRQAADEYVAHIAEKMDLSEVEKSIWDRILDFILARLKEVGFANLDRGDIENVIRASYRNLARNGGSSQVTGQGETMASKKMSERRQEKNRINNVLDEVGGIIYGNKEYAKKQRLKREAERKELAKEIYSAVLKGDFNDVILSQIDKFIEDATPANPFGRRISQRLPQRMERALRQGARTNAVDALFSRISESAVPANERFSEAGRREIEERKKELLKGWAIATGNWHTDLKEFTDDTEPIGEGKDSKVYSSKDGRYVIKASKGKPFGKRFRPDIDNIALFNDVFRDTRYEILGYGEIDGEFVRILQQPIVDFAESTPLTSEERREYMQSLGFERLNDANTAFADGEIVIADLQKGNVVRDAAGNISVIDADAKLHTKDVGGDYTYPPVETDLPEGTDLGGTMFRRANKNQDIFVSNAQRAVEGIKQEKATPEQWIAMLKKNGGLKAGEEAWLGLEEWLSEKQGAVTKQEILEFIGENKIQIEEVNYQGSEEDLNDSRGLIAKMRGEDFADEFLIAFDIEYGEFGIYDEEKAFELYKRENGTEAADGEKILAWAEGVMNEAQDNARPINSTRFDYTTEGLENKREIALTVPTIEPYNASDETHFGDAGNGRAVAWVRFGETTDSEGNRVLVIDEIQSKRHQDGREKGYRSNADKFLKDNGIEVVETDTHIEFYKNGEIDKRFAKALFNTDIEKAKNLYVAGYEKTAIPSAPFEKNWHELAMKRMLRLAAEEGFDKVAWITGEQQAERYNLGKAFNDIEREDNPSIEGRRFVLNGANVETFQVDENGNIIDSTIEEAKNKPLVEVVGKDMAVKMMSLENGDMLEGEELRIGGEGMKGFYDRMLPSFVQKYTKKWGAKVGEVTMPNLRENNTMHSVDVTPEMKESVMEGQTMFRRGDIPEVEQQRAKQQMLELIQPFAKEKREEEKLKDAERVINEFNRTHKGATKKVVVSKGKETLVQQMRDAGFTDLSIEVAMRHYEGENDATDGAYYVSSDGIVIYDTENLDITLWHENTHRAIQIMFGGDLSEVQTVYKELPDYIKEDVSSKLNAKKYSEEDIAEEAVCFFVEEAYAGGLLQNGNDNIEGIFGEEESSIKDFAKFAQRLIDYINYGEGYKSEGVSERVSEELRESAIQERNSRSNKNGEGIDKAAGGKEGTRFRISEEYTDELISKMRENAELLLPRLLTEEVWKNEIEGKTFQSPVGPVKLGENQFDKNKGKGREKEFGMIIPTLERPDLIFEEFAPEEGAERQTKYVFAKAFYDSEGNKHVYYADVSVLKDGMEAVTSSHHLRPNQLRNKIKEEHLLWNRFASDSSSSAQGSSTDQNNAPSADKSSDNSLNTQEGETRFSREVEEVEADGSIDDVKTAPLTLMERITNSLLEVSAKNKENLGLRADALRAYGRDLKDILKRMMSTQRWYDDLPKEQKKAVGKELWKVRRGVAATQRTYDKSTVDQLVKLAKMYFKNAQLVGEVDTYTMGRILSVINNVVGRKDISANAEKLMDILMDAHNKALGKVLAKAEKVKPKKINASGVEVIGSLDMYGQEMVESYNAGKLINGKQLDDAISDAYNNLADKDREVRKVFNLDEDTDVEKFADEYIPTGEDSKDATIEDYKKSRASVQGYELAREYVDNIQSAVKEIADLEKELKDAHMAKRKGEMSQEAYNEFRKSTMEAIFESKVGMIDAYHSLISKFSEGVRESGKRAKAFQQAQIDRVKAIQHNANSDMEGHPAKVQGKKPTRHNNAITRALMSPLGTFQTILEKFGEKAVDGKGYLYDRFMTQVTDAGHKEFEGIVAARATIEIKLKELFGKRFDTNKFCSRLREHCATISYIEGGKEHSFELTRGQALYIYMANKMTDGQMKLRKMGITEEVVASLVKELPEKMVLFADWVQDDLMATLRGKYNAVHERLFGVSMAAIENYFPLKIRKEGIGEKKELGQDAEAKPSTITGAIIKRTKNSAALDLSADAMQVLFEHIDQMEHWAAFAEFNRDVNSLINYRHFQNQVKSMTTLRYGSGDVLWKNFQNVVAIATETYKPERSEFDKAVLNITKGITRSKINFRLYTALKQVLSAPAFWNNAGVKELAFAYANPAGSIKWAMENLPGFKERWMSRSMGNEKLLNEESDWKVFRTKFVENATKWGMTPNAAVDALTVAQGARAVYLTKLRQFKDAGYSEEQAEKKALQRAAESYNESQQSSEGAYLSAMQASGTAAAAIFTTFKNSNFGYTRKTAQAVANISRKMHAGYKKETIEFMKKKMMREGLTEEQAEKFATKIYYKSLYKDVADVALFGVGLGFLWNFGGMAIYLIAGDDDDEKENIWEEIAIRSSLDSLNGIPFGETAINAVMAAREGNMGNIRLPEFIAFGDVKNLAKVWDTDRVKFANDLINMLLAAGVGVEAKPLTDLLVAIGDIEDWSAEEFGLFVLRTMSAPQSQLDKLLVDDAMENKAANLEEVAMRYIQYKKGKDTPITGWMYSDEGEQEAVERYGKRFAKYLDERLENVVEDNDTFDVFYNSSEPGVKKSLSSMRQKFLAGENADRYQKFSSRNLILDALEVLKGNLETSVEDATYFEMTNSEDVDATYLMKSEMLKHEDVYKTWNKLEGTEKREYGRLHEKELDYYKGLKKKTDGISRYKSKMKESPENAERNMTKIREKQTQAIELINNYRNE